MPSLHRLSRSILPRDDSVDECGIVNQWPTRSKKKEGYLNNIGFGLGNTHRNISFREYWITEYVLGCVRTIHFHLFHILVNTPFSYHHFKLFLSLYISIFSTFTLFNTQHILPLRKANFCSVKNFQPKGDLTEFKRLST